jgi:hypothetical protein
MPWEMQAQLQVSGAQVASGDCQWLPISQGPKEKLLRLRRGRTGSERSVTVKIWQLSKKSVYSEHRTPALSANEWTHCVSSQL